MADKIIENNQVSVMGRIATGFTFSHQVFGEGFYMMDILVKRLSDSEDRIPVMVSERLIDITQDYVGEYIEKKLCRSIRSFWTDISVNRLYTEKHRWEERSQIF